MNQIGEKIVITKHDKAFKIKVRRNVIYVFLNHMHTFDAYLTRRGVIKEICVDLSNKQLINWVDWAV